MADTLPNLSHRRPPTTDRGFWQCECGTLVFGDDSPAGFICPAAIAAWGAEQRDAAAAKERAAVVAGYAIREPGALLLPLPDGVVGRPETP